MFLVTLLCAPIHTYLIYVFYYAVGRKENLKNGMNDLKLTKIIEKFRDPGEHYLTD